MLRFRHDIFISAVMFAIAVFQLVRHSMKPARMGTHYSRCSVHLVFPRVTNSVNHCSVRKQPDQAHIYIKVVQKTIKCIVCVAFNYGDVATISKILRQANHFRIVSHQPEHGIK